MPSLVRNAVAMLAARLAPPVFSFAINVAIARAYGSAMLGAYVYLLSLLMIFQAVAGAGMALLLTRELASRPEDSLGLIRQSRTIALVSGLVASAGFFLYARETAATGSELAALALTTSLLPSAWIAVQEAYFVARREHHAVTAIALVENVVKLGLAALVFVLGGGLAALCAAIALARVVALAVGQALMAARGCPWSWRPDVRGAGPLARTLPPFAAMMVLAMLYFRVDVLVIGALRGDHDTGVYGAALTLYSIALLIPDSAMSAVYPRLASSFRAEVRGAARATLLAAKLLATALVVVAIGLIVVAQPLLHLVYGARFDDSAPVLRLLAASLPIHGVNAALGQALQASGHQRAMLTVAAIGTAVHVAVTLALVSAYGIAGAPLALIASSSFLALLSLWLFDRRIDRVRLGFGALVGASALVAPILLALAAPRGLELPAAAAGALCLAIALRLNGVFGRSELDEMARVLRPARAQVQA